MNENELNITFPDQETKWQFMDLFNSNKGMDFLISNGVDVSCCSECEKGKPEISKDYGEAGWMEFEL